MLDLMLGILITYRLTWLIHAERCPFELCAKFRDIIGIAYDERGTPEAKNEAAMAVLCFACLSIWLGLVATLILSTPFYHALAYSAGALMVKRIIHS